MKDLLKDVVGYEGLYEVSNLGYIKSAGGKKMTGTGNNKKKNWYLRVNLSKDKEIKSKYIHRLVAQAFIPNPENKPCVNHKNSIKTDNRVENLEWCTHKENTVCAWSGGLMEKSREVFKYERNRFNIKGENNPRSKLTNKQVLAIRREYRPGKSMSKLAKQYGVSRTKIYQIIKRECWKHI